MSRKRDYFSEIEEIQSRNLRRGNRVQHVKRRILPLIGACLEIKEKDFADRDVRKELLRYIPIWAISIVEGWFRMAVAELINRSELCRKNATLFKEMKFEPRDILNIQGKKVGAGGLIAHILPVSKLEDVVGSITTIIGEDFKEKFRYISITTNIILHSETIGNQTEQIFKALNRTFELRHIFCHEFATIFKISAKEIEDCLLRVLLFLVGAEKIVQEVLK